MDAEQFKVVQDLHNDVWGEELLGVLCSKIVECYLSRKERQILELKVQKGLERPENLRYEDIKTINRKENVAIAKLLMVKVSSVERMIYNIKHKFRNDGLESRMDDKVRKYKFNRGLHVKEDNQ